jgi:hypothetical protein
LLKIIQINDKHCSKANQAKVAKCLFSMLSFALRKKIQEEATRNFS